MPGISKSRETKLKTIQDLDRISDAHLQWMSGYHRVLICGAPADPEVAAPDAHRTCAFGTWYGSLDLAEYQSWSAHLKQIDAMHRQMHETAARLLHGRAKIPLFAEEYDRFAEHVYRFKTGIRALQMKLIKDVCLVDHLTGVWNRSSLTQRVSEEHDRVLRHGGSCCLSMMDLDHFKAINDRHGHAVGDEVLQEVTKIARQRLRRYDSVFRYGGEEFLFCLPRTSPFEAVASMERIRADIAEARLAAGSGLDIRITASFGVAELSVSRPIEESIEAADHALFQAKAGGRNRIFVAAGVAEAGAALSG